MDPIANMLTKIRNAQKVGHPSIVVSNSKIKSAILDVLKKAGYVKSVKKNKEEATSKELIVELKYDDKKPAIRHIERVSAPGCRIYVSKDHIPYVLSGQGRAVISTSKGLMTDKEARKQKLGGEVICKVW